MGDELDFYGANAALAGAEVLDVDTMRLLYRVECTGDDFYNGLADLVGHPEAAELLRRNGREELGHAERIRQAIGLKLGREYEPEGADLERFDVPLPDEISPRLFPSILKAELAGDIGYQKWAEGESDPAIARLLRQNGREETQHGRRVEQVMGLLGVEV